MLVELSTIALAWRTGHMPLALGGAGPSKLQRLGEELDAALEDQKDVVFYAGTFEQIRGTLIRAGALKPDDRHANICELIDELLPPAKGSTGATNP